MEDIQENWSWYNLRLIWLAGFGIFTAAYNNAIISSTLGQPTFYSTLGLDPTSSHTTTVISTSNAIYFLGAFVSCAILTAVGDKFGRKKTIWASLFFLIIGSALQTGVTNVPMYQVARVITGFGSGSLFSTIPVYQAEISPPSFRGFLVAQGGVFSALGYSCSSWIGYGAYFAQSKALGTFGFRFPISVGCLLAVVMVPVSFCLPESPRWLIEHGRDAEGVRLLAKLHPDKNSPDTEHFAQLEAVEIKKQRELDARLRKAEGKWSVVTKKSNLKRLFFSCFILWSANGMGILVINNYSVLLYNSLGYTGGDALLLSAGWISVTIPFNALAPFLIDRLGRKRMFLIGSFFLGIALSGEGALTKYFVKTANTSYACGGIFFLYFFAFIYGTFIDAASWVFTAEIWPNHIRALGCGISFAFSYASTILWTQTAPIGFEHIGWKFYMVFVANCIVCFIVVFFIYPETKNIPLEEIPKLFGDEIATVDIHQMNEQDLAQDHDIFKVDEQITKVG
ncbi:uncharacterized protein Z520_07488 [Fonsecaea multimorphosa CBS 102226]|uniref:Major facilitator superfamily (MFS) profile domain-containing protein n=1 Tax=Fonsecaea multimorphosa CBS 102226 TaxID=1442371 RepID=A0A0D2KJK7_9EURO|nr:uncharacterized protein Z520_07488 [Fonsecaea multimorphosa CBS 102226]KIX96768.1 hypothetical protein Z520_07488 [Fonsecaea multimorphosa CBS 102226]